MRKWLASAACAIAVFHLVTPRPAPAQGWLGAIEQARQKALAAKAAKDSAAATLREMRGGSAAADSGASVPVSTRGGQAGGEVMRTATPAVRRRGSCMAYNTFQCAAPASLGGSVDGAIGANNAEVFYRFTVAEPGVHRFVLDLMPNRQQIRLKVTDAQYEQTGSFVWETGQPGTQLLQIAAPGTYYAQLTGWNGTAVEPFSFTVARHGRSRPAPAAPRPTDDAPGAAAGCSLNNTFQCADQAEVGTRITGAIGGNARRLFYRVVVNDPGTMTFALNPMPNRAAVLVTVTNEQYQRLGRLSYAAGQPRTQLLRLAAPGTYYVQLDGGGRDAERFALTTNQ